VQAREWVNSLVRDINREIKNADLEESNNAISYLRRQLQETQLVEMQRVFYGLIESQIRVSMLADVREEYIFQVIDPAVVPDRPFSPQRFVLTLLGLAGGFVLGIFYVIFRIVIRK
jgi:LPS O-antigen subunit length determinant protein (WzzB/FepE family)